jgi:hypothetical protein
MESNFDALQHYTQQSEVTDPGEQARLLEGLPLEIPALCEVLQGLLIHVLETWRYGVRPGQARMREAHICRVEGMLERIVELDRRPLMASRAPEARLVATCHDFSVLLCATLRHQGRPARPRVGFASYLLPGMHSDHWICEHWEPQEQRWVRVDAQLDAVHQEAYGIDFDPCDLPSEAFLTAGEAWQRCRSGQADADFFGFSRWAGLGYVRHGVLRDLLALNRVEILPWQPAGLPQKAEEEVSEGERAWLDRIAALTVAGNGTFPELRSAYEEVMRLGGPPDWQPWRLEEVFRVGQWPPAAGRANS